MLRDDIERRDRPEGGDDQRQIDEHHLEPAHIETHDHHRQRERGNHQHQRIRDVGSEVKTGFGFLAPGNIGLQDTAQQLDGDLRETLGPAGLLHLKTVSLDRQFRRAFDRGHVDKTPAFQLGAIAEIGIFGERIVLPAARIFYHASAEDSRCAVEIEKQPGARTRAMLDDEVAIEQHRFYFSEQVVVPVEIRPARLHNADLGVGEEVDGAHQEIRWDDKIGVEDGNQLPAGRLHACLQGARFEARAVAAVKVLDRQTGGGVFGDQALSEGMGVVGGVVQDLYLQKLARVIHLADGFYEALDHVAFVEERKLDGDAGKLRKSARGFQRNPPLMLAVLTNHFKPVAAVTRQHHQHGEVRDQNHPVKELEMMDIAKRVVENRVDQLVCGGTGGERQRGGDHSAFPGKLDSKACDRKVRKLKDCLRMLGLRYYLGAFTSQFSAIEPSFYRRKAQ